MSTNITIFSLVSVGLIVNSLASAQSLNREVHQTGKKCVSQLTFSPDGKCLAAAIGTPGDKHIINVYSTANGKLETVFEGHDKQVFCLKFSSDSSTLVSGGADGICKIWDVKQKILLHKFTGHTDRILSIIILADGKRVISSATDKSIIEWSIDDPKQFNVLFNDHQSISTISSIDDKHFLSCDNHGVVRVWSHSTRKEVFNYHASKTPITGIGCDVNGTSLITIDDDGYVKLWSIDTKMKTHNDIATWHMGRSRPIALAMDNIKKRIVIGCFSGEVVILALKESDLVSEIKLNAHQFPVYALSVSNDGTSFATGSPIEPNFSVWKKW